MESPDRLAEPIVVPEYPWESCGVTLYGSVLREDDRFRMWYMAMGENGSQTMCHAESEDGLVWHKTMMDHIPYGDHRQTNIVLGPDVNIHGPCVLRNPDPDDLDRSYLVFYDSYSRYRPEIQRVQSEDRWTYTASSPDGPALDSGQGHSGGSRQKRHRAERCLGPGAATLPRIHAGCDDGSGRPSRPVRAPVVIDGLRDVDAGS